MASPIDKLFEEIFGEAPNKSGTAFEMLAAIVTHMISGGDVKHDDKLRGQFSKTLYQLDIHQKKDDETLMGEAKDYTFRDGKVGRGDVQKLAGALPDLEEIDGGTFFSATGYTKPAIKYANEAENIIGKPITLYGLRPSTELDEKGFIKTIVINMHLTIPHPQKGKWLPHITQNGQIALKSLLKAGEEKLEYQVGLEFFYDENGKHLLTLKELTSHGYGDINTETDKSSACFTLPNHYIDINGVLAEIHGLEYEIPYTYLSEEIRISDDSKNRLVLLDSKGSPINIITDEKLKEYEFDESGNLIKR
jgi:hypothetical protein